jgi:cytochrome c-type biogenesis protein CcmH
MMRRYLLGFLLMVVCLSSLAEGKRYHFSSDLNEKRFQAFEHGTRCLICQNQSIAESNSAFSEDLKQWLFEAIESGKTDPEIKMALIERFGDSIFYSPPLQANTILLWGLPGIFVLTGLLTLIRRRRP